jgi:hypothetical protein
MSTSLVERELTIALREARVPRSASLRGTRSFMAQGQFDASAENVRNAVAKVSISPARRGNLAIAAGCEK